MIAGDIYVATEVTYALLIEFMLDTALAVNQIRRRRHRNLD